MALEVTVCTADFWLAPPTMSQAQRKGCPCPSTPLKVTLVSLQTMEKVPPPPQRLLDAQIGWVEFLDHRRTVGGHGRSLRRRVRARPARCLAFPSPTREPRPSRAGFHRPKPCAVRAVSWVGETTFSSKQWRSRMKKAPFCPKKIEAIKTAVIPDGLAVLMFPIVEGNHGGGRREGIVAAEPLARLRQRLDLNLSGLGLLGQERHLAASGPFSSPPNQMSFLVRPGYSQRPAQGW